MKLYYYFLIIGFFATIMAKAAESAKNSNQELLKQIVQNHLKIHPRSSWMMPIQKKTIAIYHLNDFLASVLGNDWLKVLENNKVEQSYIQSIMCQEIKTNDVFPDSEMLQQQNAPADTAPLPPATTIFHQINALKYYRITFIIPIAVLAVCMLYCINNETTEPYSINPQDPILDNQTAHNSG